MAIVSNAVAVPTVTLDLNSSSESSSSLKGLLLFGQTLLLIGTVVPDVDWIHLLIHPFLSVI